MLRTNNVYKIFFKLKLYSFDHNCLYAEVVPNSHTYIDILNMRVLSIFLFIRSGHILCFKLLKFMQRTRLKNST